MPLLEPLLEPLPEPLLPDDPLRLLDSMSLSASSPIRSLLSPDDPPRELPDDPLRLDDSPNPSDEPLDAPFVAELPIPSSPMFQRSVRLPEDPLLPDDPLELPLARCEPWSFSRSAMV
jgi:hypothetical protein